MTDAATAACCGPTCLRGTPDTGPCVAPTYGAAILARLRAVGYAAVPVELVEELAEDLAAHLDRDYPRECARKTRDMAPVMRARAAIAAAEQWP